jgi:hypothetical protein
MIDKKRGKQKMEDSTIEAGALAKENGGGWKN